MTLNLSNQIQLTKLIPPLWDHQIQPIGVILNSSMYNGGTFEEGSVFNTMIADFENLSLISQESKNMKQLSICPLTLKITDLAQSTLAILHIKISKFFML